MPPPSKALLVLEASLLNPFQKRGPGNVIHRTPKGGLAEASLGMPFTEEAVLLRDA